MNGGNKTAGTPQECPNVGPYFRDANNVAKFLKEENIYNASYDDISKVVIYI